MKNGWKSQALGELGTAIREQAKIAPHLAYELWSVPSFQTGTPEIALGKDIGSAKLLLRPNDILICKINPRINRVWLVDKPIDGHEQIGSTEWLVFRANPDADLSPKWLIHFVSAPRFREWIESEVTGATGSHTRAKSDGILRQEIPLPPLAEQQRIVGLLGDALEGIASAITNAERNVANARALFDSHLQSVFSKRGSGWLDRPFTNCIDNVTYTPKIQRTAFLEKGEFPIVSQEAEFINGYWDNAADVFRVNSPIVVFGDHTRVLKYIDFDFVLGADGVKLLQPKPFLDPKFFFYALRSAPLESLGYARHYRLLKELQIGYPSTNAQVAIAKKLDGLADETHHLARLYERKIAAMEALKESLLHHAFTRGF